MADNVPPEPSRPSKAALRHEAFYGVRNAPMRARRKDSEASDDSQPAPEGAGTEESSDQDGGASFLESKRAYREMLRTKGKQARAVDNRWVPIGPSALRKGAAANKPVVSGRVSSIAVAPGGDRVYVGAANGGVWRSLDRGETWTSLMEAFDLNPERDGSDSLAVGALALVAGDTPEEDVIYVGSGEAIDGGANPVSGPLMGVGPIVSFNGGQDWQTELGAPGGPWSRLEGNGFFDLAVDPSDPTRVLAASLTGLFKREPAPLSTGFYRWRHIALPNLPRSTPVTSVVAAKPPNSGTVFFAAISGGAVFRSTDAGETWQPFGTNAPTNAGRVRLAVEPTRTDVVYLFDSNFSLMRWSAGDDLWRFVRRLSTSSSGTSGPQAANVNGQWNLAVAVAPGNVDRVYIGGGATLVDEGGWLLQNGSAFGATLFRCEPATNGQSSSLHYIGGSVHPDVHAIAFPPGEADEMWVGCDGGVFYSDQPAGEDGGLIPSPSGNSPERLYFQSKNKGLQTLMLHYIGQHPTEDAVLFAGTQDNGCMRYTGEAVWLHAQGGDCGAVLVHTENPYRVLAGLQFQSQVGRPLIRRSRFGGNLGSFEDLPDRPSGVDTRTLFYYPLAAPPAGAGSPNRVAFGSVQVWLSENFGRTWETVPSGDPDADELVGPVRAITFASADRFYVGTHSDANVFPDMGVYRFDRVGSQFQRTRIDTSSFPLFGLPFDGSVSDIAIDWEDSTGSSIYVTFSGFGSFGFLWHFDGTIWRRRDGGNPGQPGSLLDISHNAVVVDPENPRTVYAGADIGIWRSTDRGNTWEPFSEALPDAAVIDLKIHPRRRLLRAATHGRGAFERRLNPTSIENIELYIRDTQLDLGRRLTVDGLDNPLQKHTQVFHWKGPDIKLDFPDRSGDYQFSAGHSIDFVEFTDELTDDGNAYGNGLEPGESHRVYAQIHNRGPDRADGVQVMALITPSSVGLPPMPNNYEEDVQQGQAISNANWQTIGIVTLDNVTQRTPQIASFVIPPDLLPAPINDQGAFAYSVLILVHHPEDEYPITPWQTSIGGLQFRLIPPVDQICKSRRLAAIKSVSQQPLVAVLSPADPPSPTPFFSFSLTPPEEIPWIRLRFKSWEPVEGARIFIPKRYMRREWRRDWKRLVNGFEPVKSDEEALKELIVWTESYTAGLEKQLGNKGAFHGEWTKERISSVREIAEECVVLEKVKAEEWIFDGLEPETKEPIYFFVQLPLTKGKKPLEEVEFEVFLEAREEKGEFRPVGGQTLRFPVKYRKR